MRSQNICLISLRFYYQIKLYNLLYQGRFYLLIACVVLSLNSKSVEACKIDLNGTSGEFWIYRNTESCKWTIGKEQKNISFVVVELQQNGVDDHCWYYHLLDYHYIEVADISNHYKIRKCSARRRFAVIIRNSPAVVRFHYQWYWYRRTTIRVSFYIILKNVTGENSQFWNPTLAQSNAGAVTVTWDKAMLPSKNYTVVPLYNYTAKEDPLLYTIEYKSDSSCVAEYLKPDALYSFQVIAFDLTNTSGSLILSSSRNVLVKNDTVRLVGGQLPNEGIVEVFQSGFWQRICPSHWWWSHNESKVLCQSLGLQNPRLYSGYGSFFDLAIAVQYLEGFRCFGTESNLNECHHINDSYAKPHCHENNFYHTLGYFVCGSPPVFQRNVTRMAGVFTSPGYPTLMVQADHRWIFSLNITHGRVVAYFDELDLRRRHRCNTSVHIQELKMSFNKVYSTPYHKSRLGMLLTLPAQVTFYSSCTSHVEDGNYGKGFRFRYLVYSEPEGGVPTLQNWTLSLSSPKFSIITATWSQVILESYEILGFAMCCNSTQEWAKETLYAVGESNSTSLSCNDLLGYTNYKVQVLVQLRERGNDTFKTYRSVYAYITTKESTPRTPPSELNVTNIGANRAVISWQPIPRKDANGALLGYIVKVYSYSTRNYTKEVKTTGTSIFIKNLQPENDYTVYVTGYTGTGSGLTGNFYFTTRYVPGDTSMLFYIIGGSLIYAVVLFALYILFRCCKRYPAKEFVVADDFHQIELKPYHLSIAYENSNVLTRKE